MAIFDFLAGVVDIIAGLFSLKNKEKPKKKSTKHTKKMELSRRNN